MNMKKSLLIAGAITSIGAGVGSVGLASAATSSTNSADNNPMSNLVDKLSSKFNLNKTDVQAVVDEERAAQDTKRQQEVEQTLTQAVTQGKLTEAQKSAILAKQKEMKAEMGSNRDAMKNKTDDERKAAMEAKRTELDQWAAQNNIPKEYQKLVMGGGHGGPRPSGM